MASTEKLMSAEDFERLRGKCHTRVPTEVVDSLVTHIVAVDLPSIDLYSAIMKGLKEYRHASKGQL
jgi:hypothetical protein